HLRCSMWRPNDITPRLCTDEVPQPVDLAARGQSGESRVQVPGGIVGVIPCTQRCRRPACHRSLHHHPLVWSRLMLIVFDLSLPSWWLRAFWTHMPETAEAAMGCCAPTSTMYCCAL